MVFGDAQSMIFALRRVWLGTLCLSVIMALPSMTLVAAEGNPTASTPATMVAKLQALAHAAEEGEHASEAGDLAKAQHEYTELHEAWETYEDGVRDRDAAGYIALENALHAVRDGLKASPPDLPALAKHFATLEHQALAAANKFAAAAPTQPVAATGESATMAGLLANLAASVDALHENAPDTARAAFDRVVQAWPGVEGEVAARSADAYDEAEGLLGRGLTAFNKTPPDLAVAAQTLANLQQTLAPFAISTRYSAFDAAAILLREGLEALLVVLSLGQIASLTGVLTLLRRMSQGL